ncbi:TorF family putative porin [Pseudomonas koreensis]|uniref:TorF family putative porin n=1 Tax=Pseudomonas koreensis TaxID=198620 RepID=A0A9X2XDV9_9PSED|nr:TorF family putative porin [Pseudomonas koreensis]MCU7246928.1 TorF family putative porin [Pseudomonas koreensis]
MKALPSLALGFFSLLPLSSHAIPLNDDFAVLVDLTLASDYRTRGISQTQNDPAAQAGLTLAHSSGLYLGAWTSNVDFGGGLKTRQEVDYYAGWLWQATEALSLDLGYIKYAYPKESQFNQGEVYAILGAYGVKVAAYYSSDAPGVDSKQSSLYSYISYETELPLDSALKLRYGNMDFKDPHLYSASGRGEEAYREWEVKLTHDLAGVVLGLSYVDTDLSQTQCLSNWGFKDVCTATVIASVSKSF